MFEVDHPVSFPRGCLFGFFEVLPNYWLFVSNVQAADNAPLRSLVSEGRRAMGIRIAVGGKSNAGGSRKPTHDPLRVIGPTGL
jgi:hypothetical protein